MKNHKNFFKKTKSLPVDEFFQKVFYDEKKLDIIIQKILLGKMVTI